MNKLLSLLVSAAIVSVSAPALAAEAVSDAAKHHSTAMNKGSVGRDSFGEKGGIKVLFLGNSITLHQSAPQLGWTNVWGMAASAKENDYVHLVVRGIEKLSKRKTEVKVMNLATFERNYRSWRAADYIADAIDFKPDILIVALGENVPAFTAPDDAKAFGVAFERLLRQFRTDNGSQPTTVVRGVFWKNVVKDEQMKAAAEKLGAVFVRADVSDQEGMTAKGLFEHPGVQGHPGDKGMAEIARRIIAGLRR